MQKQYVYFDLLKFTWLQKSEENVYECNGIKTCAFRLPRERSIEDTVHRFVSDYGMVVQQRACIHLTWTSNKRLFETERDEVQRQTTQATVSCSRTRPSVVTDHLPSR